MPATAAFVEVVAHRGASAERPEHTAEAYALALAHGADALELDVRATADGELVVVHDPTLLRTCGVARRVDELTRADLAALGAARPLLLDEVLARYGRATRYLIELKDPHPAWEGEVARAVVRHGVGDLTTLQSFDLVALRRLGRHAPALPLAALLRWAPARFGRLATFVDAVSVAHTWLDAGAVARARAAGLAVRAWTVNDPADVARVLNAGVDGVITDVPGAVRRTVGRRANAAAA